MAHRLSSLRPRLSRRRSSDASVDSAEMGAAPTGRLSRTRTAGAPAWWGAAPRDAAADGPRTPPRRSSVRGPSSGRYTRLPPSGAAGPPPVVAAGSADAEAALLAAAAAGDSAAADTLLRSGSRADAVDAAGNPPVVVASRAGHAAVVEVLLWFDAVERVRGGEGRDRADGGSPSGDRAAADGGGGVAARGAGGKTPLHWAAAGGHDAIVEILLAAGAEVNATDAAGGTALQEAVAAGCGRAVEALTAAGACVAVCARRRPGEPLLYGAIVRGHVPADGRAAVVRALAAAGADVDAPLNDDGQTPLHVAVRARQAGVVAALVAVGARRTAIDVSGRTPLGLCVADFPADLVALLVAKHRVRRGGRWVTEGGCVGSASELAELVAAAKAQRRLLLWRALKELEIGGGGGADAACVRRRPPLVVLPPYCVPQRGGGEPSTVGRIQQTAAASSTGGTLSATRAHIRRQASPTLAGVNDLPAVYKAAVRCPSLLTLGTLREKLVADNARGVASLRAGHNLLCLAADAGLFSSDQASDGGATQGAWQLGLYLPVQVVLAPADVPLARLIVADATARGFLAPWQAQLLQDHHRGGFPSAETTQGLFLRAHRLAGVSVEALVEAAGTAQRELAGLHHRLTEVPVSERRPLLIEEVPRVGLSLVLLVAAALPRGGAPAKAAAAAEVSAAATSAVDREALDFAVCHSNLRAALRVLTFSPAASQTALRTAVESAWGSYEEFVGVLASVVDAAAASAFILPSASLFSVSSWGGGDGGGCGGGGGTSLVRSPCCSDGGEAPTTSTVSVSASGSGKIPPPLFPSRSALGP